MADLHALPKSRAWKPSTFGVVMTAKPAWGEDTPDLAQKPAGIGDVLDQVGKMDDGKRFSPGTCASSRVPDKDGTPRCAIPYSADSRQTSTPLASHPSPFMDSISIPVAHPMSRNERGAGERGVSSLKPMSLRPSFIRPKKMRSFSSS